MKFNKLIHTILSEVKIKPNLNEEVEKYITYVKSWSSFPHGPYVCGQVIKDDSFFTYEYVREMCYQGFSFPHALNAYYKALSNISSVPYYIIDDAVYQARQFSDLDNIAKFQVCVTSIAIYMKVEIDKARVRANNINNDLKDVDTSGLTDLL